MRALYRDIVVKRELTWKQKLSIYQSIYIPAIICGALGCDRKNEIGDTSIRNLITNVFLIVFGRQWRPLVRKEQQTIHFVVGFGLYIVSFFTKKKTHDVFSWTFCFTAVNSMIWSETMHVNQSLWGKIRGRGLFKVDRVVIFSDISATQPGYSTNSTNVMCTYVVWMKYMCIYRCSVLCSSVRWLETEGETDHEMRNVLHHHTNLIHFLKLCNPCSHFPSFCPHIRRYFQSWFLLVFHLMVWFCLN